MPERAIHERVETLARPIPPAKQVRETLDRLLSSETFGRSERARALIRYLVEQQLAGASARLKGFAIAIDVFGRDANFDPSTDAVVRVQAGRLRELLDQYYADEGAGDALRIRIPRGSYVPEYSLIDPEETGPESERTPGRAPGARWPRVVLPAGAFYAVAACVVLVAALAYHLGSRTAGQELRAATLGTSASSPAGELPSIYVDLRGDDPNARALATTLRLGLSASDTVNLVARPHAEDDVEPEPTDFVFVIYTADHSGEVGIELQSAREGTVLSSRSIAVEGRSESWLHDAVANILLESVRPTGVIYGHVRDRGGRTPLMRCLSLSERYHFDQSEEMHGRAYRCLDELAQANMLSPLLHAQLASLHVSAVTRGFAYPEAATHAAALEIARRAVRLGPNSPAAHRALGHALLRAGMIDEALRWYAKAHDLNSFDFGTAAAYANALIMAGQFEKGTPILQSAVHAASSHPSWWDYGLFLGQFMLDDSSAARDATIALAHSTRAHHLAARLIVADWNGDRLEAGRLVETLSSSFTTFTADPSAYFRQAHYPPELAERLVAALRRAGLANAS